MGLEPFLVSSSLLIVCAQRLLRRLCTECSTPYAPSAEERRMIGASPDEAVELFRPVGCARCNDIGYRGRIGVHELLIPDDRMRKAISQGITSEDLKKLSVTECGMITLYWDAMEKVRAGICALEDAIADIRQDEFDSRPRACALSTPA
jgi:type II secretory ATPase GspE/PulE/Tfp pilus assembly ATPase PilB-like protein